MNTQQDKHQEHQAHQAKQVAQPADESLKKHGDQLEKPLHDAIAPDSQSNQDSQDSQDSRRREGDRQ
ncbi:hypothetical protein [Noviherbaspirillum aerium]|uniref:hypothetical protein n=1 Tax=Noviherbaspirillum aerium TaxID=2588497 RepID=UPI00124BF917|nr:hypothetical protein [Noviherbaspirillum aerium]